MSNGNRGWYTNQFGMQLPVGQVYLGPPPALVEEEERRREYNQYNVYSALSNSEKIAFLEQKLNGLPSARRPGVARR